MKKVNRIDQIGQPRFRIAVHTLVWLAEKECVCSSKAIAEQLNSHATFLRRVLATLSQAGIVEAREGREGGYCLKKSVEEISLSEVYLAIKKQECEEAKSKAQADCDELGLQLDQRLEEIMIVGEQLIIDYLKQFTLADIISDLPCK
ncbi:Rrf2 family transcriptional regulator [Bacillus sp. AGMB 02131]|uniref:Rrf2 family transcriptional regulator n=1 Tax=Peribacillus faecalis TaxID=2772559 RepID=A0A927CW24_9BACI|nr:Rrf2 family transcriptional regulator [Peribacillus faecalis]MBD3108586.1 Rrf2 family transcriptional regulator [Peribacillus faecalis]